MPSFLMLYLVDLLLLLLQAESAIPGGSREEGPEHPLQQLAVFQPAILGLKTSRRDIWTALH